MFLWLIWRVTVMILTTKTYCNWAAQNSTFPTHLNRLKKYPVHFAHEPISSTKKDRKNRYFSPYRLSKISINIQFQETLWLGNNRELSFVLFILWSHKNISTRFQSVITTLIKNYIQIFFYVQKTKVGC